MLISNGQDAPAAVPPCSCPLALTHSRFPAPLSEEKQKGDMFWLELNDEASCHLPYFWGESYSFNNIPCFLFLHRLSGLGRTWPQQKEVGLLQIVYSTDPVLSLAAFTSLSLKVTRSRYAKRLQHFRIVLLARRTSWKPLNISPGLSLANIPVRRC